jgi:hypothetical protein|tara:strand:- start:643 stop:1395 length:753 start_codon:yes stop_codon:yes gene_type:complete
MAKKEKPKFPTEIVPLPSGGKYYPDGHPLSSGEVEVKYMTAKEEDILTSQNLIKQGKVIDVLLDSLVQGDFDMNDMLIGDKNAVMIAARVLGYGKDYEFEMEDPLTGEKEKQVLDLTTLDHKEIDFDGDYTFELPNSKRVLGWKFITQRDENEITEELKALRKVTKRSGIEQEVTTRLRKVITSVDGDESVGTINNFVNNEFLSRDSKAFRDYLLSVTPDVDLNIIVDFSSGEEVEVTVPMTVEFFWPKS